MHHHLGVETAPQAGTTVASIAAVLKFDNTARISIEEALNAVIHSGDPLNIQAVIVPWWGTLP